MFNYKKAITITFIFYLLLITDLECYNPQIQKLKLYYGNIESIQATIGLLPQPIITKNKNTKLKCQTNNTNINIEQQDWTFSWPPNPHDLAHQVHCHDHQLVNDNNELNESDTTICVPSHLFSPKVSDRRNLLTKLVALLLLSHKGDNDNGNGDGDDNVDGYRNEMVYSDYGDNGVDDNGFVGLVLDLSRRVDLVNSSYFSVVKTVPIDSFKSCKWDLSNNENEIIPNLREKVINQSNDKKLFSPIQMIKNAISIAISATQISKELVTGSSIYSELLPDHHNHLPSYRREVLAEKGESKYEVFAQEQDQLNHLSHRLNFNEADVIRIHKEGDNHDRCVVNPLCVWEDKSDQGEITEDKTNATYHIFEYEFGNCVCGRTFEVTNFQKRSLLNGKAFFELPKKQSDQVSFLEVSGKEELEIGLYAASQVCLTVDMAQEISVMVKEHLETTFIVMLVQMVVIPVVIAILMPLIVKVFAAIMPPIINSLQSIFEQFIKPPMEQAMKMKPEYMGGPITSKNGGEVGELFSYFQHHREATMYSMLGLGDFLDLNPFIALAVWWITDMIAGVLFSGSSNRVSSGMGSLLPMAVKNTVPAVLVSVVVKLQAQEITRRIAHSTVHEVTNGVTHGLTHSLTRSVTIAVTHGLEQSRKHYYYCLYCYYTGAYCQFCTTYNEWAQNGNKLTINDQGPVAAKILTKIKPVEVPKPNTPTKVVDPKLVSKEKPEKPETQDLNTAKEKEKPVGTKEKEGNKKEKNKSTETGSKKPETKPQVDNSKKSAAKPAPAAKVSQPKAVPKAAPKGKLR